MTANPTPFTFNEAIQAFRMNAEQKRDALRDWERAIQIASEKEGVYRLAFHRAIVLAEGRSAAEREAAAKAAVVMEEAERTVAKNMTEVARDRFRMLEGERANLNNLSDWSKRVDSGYGG